MAVTTQESTEYANIESTVPVVLNSPAEVHGNVKIAYFTCNQSGAGDATSSFALVRLPAGRVRLLAKSSSAYVNWTTASATIDLGWDAYTDFNGDTVAADVNGIDDGVSVESAGTINFGAALNATGGSKVFESKDGVLIRASSTDTAIADDDDLVGYLLYVAD